MGKDSVYLKHILDAINVIEEYIKGIDFEEFQEHKNKLIQDGVIRELEIVGEAVKNISADFRNFHGEIPWKDTAGMRDKLIHVYFGVDLEAVWQTVQKDLPKLKVQIENILAEIVN